MSRDKFSDVDPNANFAPDLIKHFCFIFCVIKPTEKGADVNLDNTAKFGVCHRVILNAKHLWQCKNHLADRQKH